MGEGGGGGGGAQASQPLLLHGPCTSHGMEVVVLASLFKAVPLLSTASAVANNGVASLVSEFAHRRYIGEYSL